MRRTAQISIATLLGLTATSSAWAQTPMDARDIRPAVMLLVDTSGSMERLPDDGSGAERMPNCTGVTTNDANQKNRWAMTVEALSGTIQNYTCSAQSRTGTGYAPDDYDYGYYLPHIFFGATPTQASDGILDSFSRRVKFGLMTFDGVGTTIGGETLVPFSNWSNATYLDQANGAPGMYSYGRVGRLSFPGCVTDYGVNAGARSATAPIGGLISVGLSDSGDDVDAVNQRIQRALLNVRPFGGTPIPAMLDDLRYYFEHDPDVRNGSDPLFACRKRRAILITDGAPDALFRDPRFQCDSTSNQSCAANTDPTSDGSRTCSCPYDTAPNITRGLLADRLVDQVIVVAYNVLDPNALATLNAIAQAGWSSDSSARPPSTGTYPYLIIANGPNELRDKLNDLLEGSQPGVTSRSVPISVNTGDAALGANSKRFDITAGFRLGRNPDEPWEGLLVRRRVLCNGTSVDDAVALDDTAGDRFDVSLTRYGAAQRNLFTVTPQDVTLANATLRNDRYTPYTSEPVQVSDRDYDPAPLSLAFATRNDNMPEGGTFGTADRLAVDDSVTLTQGLSTTSVNSNVPFTSSVSSLFFGDANNNNIVGESADRQMIVDYVRGVTRPNNLLADIYHSNPVALVPSSASNTFDDADRTYAQWRRDIVRTTSGAHYGPGGRPGVVFVGTNDGVLHAFNLDDWTDRNSTTVPGGRELWGFVPPALFGKMAAMVRPVHQFMFDGTPQVKDVVLQKTATGAPIYRTILVSSVRGAPAYVALDVTQPELPQFMWQTTFPDVGDTVGNVALTQVSVDWNGRTQRRGIAILPGGSGEAAASCTAGQTVVSRRNRAAFPNPDARNAVRCWKRKGRALYVVDLATGQLIQEFGAEHFPSPLTGSVVVDSPGVANSTAAYFVDHDGVLWRLSMVESDPSRWRVAPIYDLFANPHIRAVSAPLTPLSPWQAGRVPMYAPALTRDTNGNLVIIVGTGDVDNALDQANHRVISLTEKRADLGGEIGGTVELNWVLDLKDNEVVTGPLTVFQNNVYWGTFTSQSGGNACALGMSERYGVHAYLPQQPRGTPPAPQPALLVEGSGSTGSRLVTSEVIDPSGSNLVLGLTVVRQPICLGSTTPNAITGQSMPNQPPGGGEYQLRGILAGNSTGGDLRGGSPIREMSNVNLRVARRASVAGWAGIVE